MTNTTTADTNCFGQNLTSGLSKGVRYTLLIVFSVILLLGILNGYRMCAYGMNFSDEPYHILNAMDYKNAPMTVLNALIGHAFGNIFGWDYLSFKYFAWTLDLLSILIAGGFLYYKTRNSLVSLGFTSAIVFFESISRLIFNLYGWDCLVAVMLSLILCLTVQYSDKSSKTLLIVISIITGLSLLVKVTTVVLIPLIAIFMVWRYRRISDALILCVLSSIVFFLGIIMIYGSLSEFITYLQTNSNNDHGSIIGLIVNHILYTFYILPYVAYFWCIFYAINKYFSSRMIVSLITVLFLIICNYFVIKTQFIIYHNSYCSFISSVGIAVASVVVTINPKVGLLILATGFTAHLGSNQSLSKFLFAPAILVSLIYIIRKDNIKKIALIGIILFVNLCIFRYQRLHEGTFPDQGIQYLTATTDISKLTGNYTSERKISQLEQTVKIANGHKTFVVGDTVNKYIYEYLFDNINHYNRQAYGKVNNYQKKPYVDSIESHVNRAPQGMQYLYLSNDTTTLMYGMLHEKMPLQRRSDDFILFVKE